MGFLAAAPAAQSALTKHDRDIAMAMLRQVRDDVVRNYYDRTFHGVDLKTQFKTAEQRLEAAGTLTDAMAAVAQPLVALDDSHTVFLPPNRTVGVDYGWQMAMVGKVPLVVAVDPTSDAAAKGINPGDRVLLLNAVEPTRANLWRLTYFYRHIGPQAQQRIAVLKPTGAATTVDVSSRMVEQRRSDVAGLVADLEDLLARARDRTAAVGSEVLVWKMAVFGTPEAVDDAIRTARGYKTLVLDLRGNGGGSVDALRELVSRTFNRDILIATERRRSNEKREIAKSRSVSFAGSLIVVVDSRSASAAEMFARIVQVEKRGTVVGDRTAGAVMTSRTFPHQIGVGPVAFFATSVTIGDVRMSDGASLEKVGVEPDEIALPTPGDLAAGRDPVLAQAVALGGAALTPEDAGRLFK